MIDWNKIKIKINDGYVYLDGINFESRIATIHHYSDKTHMAYFTILDINVQTIIEGKTVLVESLKNFILNLGIPVKRINLSDIKWVGDFGTLVGYINRQKIFTIDQIAPLNYFYKAFGYIESIHVLSLNGYEKDIENSINIFMEKVLTPIKSGKEAIM